jgi:hypothetical protein
VDQYGEVMGIYQGLKDRVIRKIRTTGPLVVNSMFIHLKEGTSSVIALVILGVTMNVLLSTFGAADNYEKKKDILLYALPLLGAVIGYYFGRLPAERRAEVAEKNLGDANKTVQESTIAVKEALKSADNSNLAKDVLTREKEAAETRTKETKAGLESAIIKLSQAFNSMLATSDFRINTLQGEDAVQSVNLPLPHEARKAMTELEVLVRML